jgi:hypothetical protein
MAIVFTCSTQGCGLEMSAPDGSTGKKVRCPRCGTLQPIPPDPRAAPAAAAPEAPPVVEALPQPRIERPLFADGLRAFLYGGSNFRSILKLVAYFLFVYIVFKLVYGIFSFFFLGTIIGVLINMAVSGTVAIVTIGYFLQFYMDVVVGSMEGLDQAPEVPSFSFSDFFGNGLRGLGVLAVYILPVVTLPLLPLGLLALACTWDMRTYNLAWAARSAGKRPGALLITWGLMLLWAVLMFPAVWVVLLMLGLLAAGILTAAPNVGGDICSCWCSTWSAWPSSEQSSARSCACSTGAWVCWGGTSRGCPTTYRRRRAPASRWPTSAAVSSPPCSWFSSFCRPYSVEKGLSGAELSSPGGVLNPLAVARPAQVQRQPAADLVHQLLLGHLGHLLDEPVDLLAGVAEQVLLVEAGRRGVGNGLDADDVEVAPPRRELGPAAVAEERGVRGIGHGRLASGQISSNMCPSLSFLVRR